MHATQNLQHYLGMDCTVLSNKATGSLGSGYALKCSKRESQATLQVIWMVVMGILLCMVVVGSVLIVKNPKESPDALKQDSDNSRLRIVGIVLVTIGCVFLIAGGIFALLFYNPRRFQVVGVYTHNNRGRKLDNPRLSVHDYY